MQGASRHCREYRSRRFLFAHVLLALVVVGCSRGRSQAAAAAALPQLSAVEFVSQWGMHGDDPGQLNDPVGPAMDGIGRVYAVDRGTGSIEKFETDGVPLLSFDYPSLRNAAGIAVDFGGGIYVADARGGAMQIFFPEGDFIRSFHIAAQRGWQGPFGFSIDDGGKVFVPDPEGGRVQVFDSHGKMIRVWKLPTSAAGQVAHPSMTVTAADGSVYVGDSQAGRIVKYSSDGQQIADWAEPAGTAAPLLSLGVSVKYVFALRDAVPHLEIWTPDGRLKMTDNLGGLLDGAPPSAGAAAPTEVAPRKPSLAVDAQDDLVVLDPAVPRILRFRIHLDPH
jgi:sugar lactone lactonase YvrE